MQKASFAFCLLLVFAVILLTFLESQRVGPGKLKFVSQYGSPLLEDQPSKENLQSSGSSSVKSYRKSTSVEDSIKARKNMLIKQCDRLEKRGSEFNIGKNTRLDHILVNDEYRVLYCFIPKVASTNLKKIFFLLTGEKNKTDPSQIKRAEVHSVSRSPFTYLNTLSAQSVQHRLKHYRKVIFVREPLERLLSAFRDKFSHGKNTSVAIRQHEAEAIKLFRENPSQQPLEDRHDLKFSAFVDYILYQKAHSQEFDKHWDEYFNLCSPCYIRYNFIGRYETLEEDVDLLLKKINPDQNVRFPKRKESYRAKKTADILEKYYMSIDPQKIIKLQDVYRLDYSLFGYKIPKAIKVLDRKVRSKNL